MQIDLQRQLIRTSMARAIRFDIDAGRKIALIEGRDEIAETLGHQGRIDRWRRENCDFVPAISIASE